MDKLKQIEQAVQEYHDALRRREHGGVAESRCMNKIENILDMHFDSSVPLSNDSVSYSHKSNNKSNY